ESAADHTGSNPYTVTVTLSHEAAPVATATSTATVSDPAVVATGGFVETGRASCREGGQTAATFTDPGGAEALGDYSASINWGDGTTASTGTITVSGSISIVKGSHTYAEESAADHAGSTPYTVTVTLSHEAAPVATATSTATVSDPAVVATGGFV